MNQQFVTIPLEDHLVPSQCIVMPQPQAINQPLLEGGICRPTGSRANPLLTSLPQAGRPQTCLPQTCCFLHTIGLVRKSGLHRATPNQARRSPLHRSIDRRPQVPATRAGDKRAPDTVQLCRSTFDPLPSAETPVAISRLKPGRRARFVRQLFQRPAFRAPESPHQGNSPIRRHCHPLTR